MKGRSTSSALYSMPLCAQAGQMASSRKERTLPAEEGSQKSVGEGGFRLQAVPLPLGKRRLRRIPTETVPWPHPGSDIGWSRGTVISQIVMVQTNLRNDGSERGTNT